MTVGRVFSDFGVVTLKTTDHAAGDIVAKVDEAVNVKAKRVCFFAAGSVGTDARALVIETGEAWTVPVGDITAPIVTIDPKTGRPGGVTGARVVFDEDTNTYQLVETIGYAWIMQQRSCRNSVFNYQCSYTFRTINFMGIYGKQIHVVNIHGNFSERLAGIGMK